MVLSALCCPDKFRGSLTAAEAAAAMAAGLRSTGIAAYELPLADGGEGTLDVLLAARGGRRRTTRVTGPLGEPVDAGWGLLPDGTAVIEMALASGLALVGDDNDPLSASTRGTGELLVEAARQGATRAIVCVGGSASTDGGLGALEALGFKLPLPVTVACDVETRYADAARVFGPQKGATAQDIETLTTRLRALDERLGVGDLPGGGAAGGLAGGLAALGATLRSGFDVVAEAVGLQAQLDRVDLVVTGEGKLDASSLDGKVVGSVLFNARCAKAVIAGYVDVTLDTAIQVSSLTERAGSPERAMREAAALVRELASELRAPERVA
jgi:glycerate kinase